MFTHRLIIKTSGRNNLLEFKLKSYRLANIFNLILLKQIEGRNFGETTMKVVLIYFGLEWQP